jgi:hypothetical protein
MAYTTVDKASANMNAVTYTGDGSSSDRTITGVGFQPDFLWNKSRSNAYNHYIFDVLRTTYMISSNATTAEEDKSPQFSAFTSDGFTIRNDAGSLAINASGVTFANWCWKAGGAGSSNSDGTITSTVSANTTSGFAVVKWTGTGSAGTIGHGLGAVPKMILMKKLSGSAGWVVYHHDVGAGKYLRLNTTDAEASDTNIFNNTAPTSSVFSVGTDADNNGSGATYIAYCFAEKPGFSKAFTYTANGSQPRFIHCNFKPIWWIGKASSNGSESWTSYDNKREGYNPQNDRLFPNTTGTESNETNIDLVSNGIVIRDTANGHLNYSNYTYVGMAFGQSIVGSNNVPCTAR